METYAEIWCKYTTFCFQMLLRILGEILLKFRPIFIWLKTGHKKKMNRAWLYSNLFTLFMVYHQSCQWKLTTVKFNEHRNQDAWVAYLKFTILHNILLFISETRWSDYKYTHIHMHIHTHTCIGDRPSKRIWDRIFSTQIPTSDIRIQDLLRWSWSILFQIFIN